MSSAPPAHDTPGQRTVALSKDLTVRVLDQGTGPVVLLLHGNPDNADEWLPLTGFLRDNFRCIAPDLPGYGRRNATHELPDGFDYSLRAQTDFVSELLTALGIDGKITLVVHDIGGIMGVPWAAQNTSRLRAVLYTNTVAFPHFRWFGLARLFGSRSAWGRFWASRNMGLIGWSHGRLFRSQFSKQNPQLDSRQIERFVEDFALNDVAKRTTLRQFRQLTREGFFDGYDEMLKTISRAVPTLAMWGEGDPYLKDPRFAEQMFARETLHLPNVGHWVPIVAAAQLAEKIRRLP